VEALARVLLENGQTEEALPYFEQALARPSLDEPARRRRYFLLLGYAQGLRLLGRSEKAALLEKEAQILLPQATPGEFGYHV
jgi:tetratricopeptide (TPR) repeat protein